MVHLHQNAYNMNMKYIFCKMSCVTINDLDFKQEVFRFGSQVYMVILTGKLFQVCILVMKIL